MVNGFHQGILRIAMEPSVLSSAFMEGGADRKIKLDRSPGVDEIRRLLNGAQLYVEGYLQAMLDTMYKQEYLWVKVIENQVILKNLPPSSSLINEIMENVKGFLASKSLLKGESSSAHSLRYIRGESNVLSREARRVKANTTKASIWKIIIIAMEPCLNHFKDAAGGRNLGAVKENATSHLTEKCTCKAALATSQNMRKDETIFIACYLNYSLGKVMNGL